MHITLLHTTAATPCTFICLYIMLRENVVATSECTQKPYLLCSHASKSHADVVYQRSRYTVWVPVPFEVCMTTAVSISNSGDLKARKSHVISHKGQIPHQTSADDMARSCRDVAALAFCTANVSLKAHATTACPASWTAIFQRYSSAVITCA
jgi:hypothetical protein